jgi:hypothetical protein
LKTIDLHIVDILHNSIRAKSKHIIINITDSDKSDKFEVILKDFGCGIDKSTLAKINQDFYSSRKERNIGMGLALLKFQTEITGGSFEIKSQLNLGTEVKACFIKSHVDMQPIGDIAGSFANFICQYQDINFELIYKTDNNHFEISSQDVKDVFQNLELNNPKIIKELANFIRQAIE